MSDEEVTHRKRSAHYDQMGTDPFTDAKRWPIEQQVGGFRLMALKYIKRIGFKHDDVGDAIKAQDCIAELIEALKKRKGE